MQKTKLKEQNTTYDLNKFVNKHMYVVKNMSLATKELRRLWICWMSFQKLMMRYLRFG